MSEYPNQPRPRDGWPTQPPRYSSDPAGQDGASGYGQAGYGPGAYGQGGGYPQDGYPQDGHPQDGHPQDGHGRNSFGQPGIGQAGYSDSGPGAPRRLRRRRRGRGWIALLIVLIVLAVLFFVGDQVARAYAQNMIADKIQSSDSLPNKPSVTIEGWPFLTQVAAHDVGRVDISASDVPAGQIDISTVKATATGVHLSSSFKSATIDHISGTALVTFASLVNAAGAHGVTISADPSAGPNAANVSLGPLSAPATVTQTGPNKITVKLGGLGAIAASFIGQLSDYTITVPKLPMGLQLEGVSVAAQGIVIKVAAQHTTLSQ